MVLTRVEAVPDYPCSLQAAHSVACGLPRCARNEPLLAETGCSVCLFHQPPAQRLKRGLMLPDKASQAGASCGGGCGMGPHL